MHYSSSQHKVRCGTPFVILALAGFGLVAAQGMTVPPLKADALALLAAVIDQVGEALISIDQGQRVTMFIKRAEELIGYSAEQAVGMSISERIPTRFRDGHRSYVSKFMTSGDTS